MFNALALAEDVDTASSVEDALPQWEKRVRPSTDRYQARSAHLTEKRALSHGDYATLLQKAKL
jgi:2-polyprenyl-6-methoxyphenol hydroxylase-like FAD-dependent oxidoreductase